MYIGLFGFYGVRFQPYFNLDLSTLHSPYAPFDLDFIFVFAATFLTLVALILDAVHLATIQ